MVLATGSIASNTWAFIFFPQLSVVQKVSWNDTNRPQLNNFSCFKSSCSFVWTFTLSLPDRLNLYVVRLSVSENLRGKSSFFAAINQFC